MKYIVSEDLSSSIIIKKSKFISFIFKVFNFEQANNAIDKIKKEYSDANHVCFAYILDQDTYKVCDDGEPSSTAGMPIFQCLKNNELLYSLCVVVRYFGGIKLGVGGLSRAYKKAVQSVLKISNIIDYNPVSRYSLICDYKDFNQLEYLLNKYAGNITKKNFEDTIKVEFEVTPTNFEKLIKEHHFDPLPFLIKKEED